MCELEVAEFQAPANDLWCWIHKTWRVKKSYSIINEHQNPSFLPA